MALDLNLKKNYLKLMSNLNAIASNNHSVTVHYFKNNYLKVKKLCKGSLNYAKNVKVSK